MKRKTIDLLDGLVYIAASIGLFVAAFSGSMIWVCACGFLFIDESITMACVRLERRADNER